MAALLEIDSLHAGYGPIEVLKGISLTVDEGEIVTVIGANGAGKTSTLTAVSGILSLNSGQIRWRGQDTRNLAPNQIVRAGIAHSPEGRRIFAKLTVLENLELGAYTRDDADGIADDLERAFAMFPILRERQSQAGGTLSGGEQQMLAVARALMARPRLLLLDEPSLGLAPLIVLRIFEVIRELNQRGMSILLVEQNARMALKLAHRGYVMETGTIVMADAASKLLTDAKVQEAYLGEGA